MCVTKLSRGGRAGGGVASAGGVGKRKGWEGTKGEMEIEIDNERYSINFNQNLCIVERA